DDVVDARGGAELEIEVAEVAVRDGRETRQASARGAPLGQRGREAELMDGEQRRTDPRRHDVRELRVLVLHEVETLGGETSRHRGPQRRVGELPAEEAREEGKRVGRDA